MDGGVEEEEMNGAGVSLLIEVWTVFRSRIWGGERCESGDEQSDITWIKINAKRTPLSPREAI